MKTLSDFCNMDIIRYGRYAEVIVDYQDNKSVKMSGFDASKTDFEIREDAYQYYIQLKNALNK